jgi:hypothetical protein
VKLLVGAPSPHGVQDNKNKEGRCLTKKKAAGQTTPIFVELAEDEM